MDPLLASVMAILGKLAISKGADLVGDIGSDAVDAAKALWDAVVGKLKSEPTGQVVVKEYEKAPQVYEKPLEQLLKQSIEADAQFRGELAELLSRHHMAAARYCGTVTSSARNRAGAVAQGQGTTAQVASDRAVFVSGAAGPVTITGDRHVSAEIYNEGADPKHIARIRYEQEVTKIEREWERERQAYVINLDGHELVPTAAQVALISGTWVIALFISLAMGVSDFLPPVSYGPFAGVLFGGGILVFRVWSKASQYQDGESRYLQRRASVSENDFM